MWDKLLELIESWWWMIPLWIATFVVGLLLMRWLILRIPADYFTRPPDERLGSGQHKWQTALWFLKNGGGVLLLIAGVVMMVTPGPGLLAIVFGVTLVDFPGKRRLEEWLVCQPRVLHAANRLRERHGVEPLVSPREMVPS
jgi:putative transmembrane protein PGPGW